MLGLSSTYFAFKGKGIYDSVKAVFDLGFDTVELGAGHVFEPRALDAVKRLKHDFPSKNYTVHGLFPPLREKLWFNASLGLTQKNRCVINGLFKAAEIAEACVVSIHPGFLSSLAPVGGAGMSEPHPLEPLEAEKCLRNFFEVADYASALAGEIGAVFAVENINAKEAQPLLASAGDFRLVFGRFPGMGFLLDFGHSLFGETTAELLRNFAPRVAEVHLHWSERRTPAHSSEDHSPITAPQQLEPLKKIAQLGKIPVIFEHGPKVRAEEIIKEKGFAENFLAGF